MATLQSINNFHQNIPTTSPIINVSSYDTTNNTSIPISSSYFGASQNTSSKINHHGGTSISGQLNDHLKNKQQTAAQPYITAASIFKIMEENISKNILNVIGAQKNKDNMMVATICNVIDTLVSNFVNVFDERFKIALNQLNKNWMNNINDINNKINGILLNMEENKKIIQGEFKEKENEYVKIEDIMIKKNQILMNNINDINKKMLLKVHSNEHLIKVIIKKLGDKNEEEENGEKVHHLLEKLTNKLENMNKKMVNINQLKKMENNLEKKLNQIPAEIINKMDDINKEILKMKQEMEETALSNAVALQRVNKNLVNINHKEISSISISTDKLNDNNNKIINNNNNKKIEISPLSSSSSSSLPTSTSTPKQILNNNDKLLIINSINKLDNNCSMEIYIDSDFEKIRGIISQCVIGKIKKIIINNKNKKKNENKFKIIICHFGKIYKFFIKPKREIIIKDLIGYNANYNFMEYPYQHLYVNGDIVSESVSLNKLISIHSLFY